MVLTRRVIIMASVVTSVVTATVTAKPTTTSATSRAASQGGILEGLNPSKYDSKNPLIMFIIQVFEFQPMCLVFFLESRC